MESWVSRYPHLFDDVKRTYKGYAQHIEDTYSFLNRSARPAAANVRALLEDWYSRYPSAEQKELKSRFLADFDVGFFELLLHELMVRSGYKVQVHPEAALPERGRVDYLGLYEHGHRLYLETTVITDQSREQKAQKRLQATLYDYINRMDLKEYWLHLSSVESLRGDQPSVEGFVHFVQERVAGLNHAEVVAKAIASEYRQLPHWKYLDAKLKVEFDLIALSAEFPTREAHRAIGVYPGVGGLVRTGEALRKAFSKKSTKYGVLGAPYIIAVNCLSQWGPPDKQQVLQALFGADDAVVGKGLDDALVRPAHNGLWSGRHAAVNRRVSGVLLCWAYPWNLPTAGVCLYCNPWAAHPYEGPLVQLPQAKVKDDKLTSVPGVLFGEILGLPQHWPGDLFDHA